MARVRHKRRRFLIDRLQLRLLAITLVYFVVAASIFSITLFAPLVIELDNGPPAGREQSDAATAFLALHTRFWPALFVTFGLVAVHSVLTSHRIVGPLYRFRAVFREVQNGNLAPWTGIRRRDLLGKEAKALADMVSSLNDRIRDIAGLHGEARMQLATVKRAVQTRSHREAQTVLAELEASLATIGERVEAFRLDPIQDDQ